VTKPPKVIKPIPDTRKIKKGEKYTYEKICSLMGLTPSYTGNPRKYQMKEIKRYLDMEFSQKTKLWTIKEVYDYPIPEPVKSDAKYIEQIEILLSYQLLASGADSCQATKQQLFLWLHMVNENYIALLSDKNKEEREAAIERIKWGKNHWIKNDLNEGLSNETIWRNIFINRTYEYLSNIIERALNSMKARCVITYEYETILCKKEYEDEEGSLFNFLEGNPYTEDTDEGQRKYKISKYKANEAEELQILNIKAHIMGELGFEKEGQVYAYNVAAEFNQRVNKELKKQLGRDFYFKQYNIRFTPNAIRHVITGLYRKMSSDVETVVRETGEELNRTIIEEMRKPDFFKYGAEYADKWLSDDVNIYFDTQLSRCMNAHAFGTSMDMAISAAVSLKDSNVLGKTWLRKLRQQMAKNKKENKI
jgi:hypothetical protein